MSIAIARHTLLSDAEATDPAFNPNPNPNPNPDFHPEPSPEPSPSLTPTPSPSPSPNQETDAAFGPPPTGAGTWAAYATEARPHVAASPAAEAAARLTRNRGAGLLLLATCYLLPLAACYLLPATYTTICHLLLLLTNLLCSFSNLLPTACPSRDRGRRGAAACARSRRGSV